MAFPSPALSQGAAETGSDTTCTVTVPAVSAGDLLLIVFANDGTATTTWGGPAWTTIVTRAGANAVSAESKARKIDGTEGWSDGGTFNVTFSANEAGTATVVKVPAAEWSGNIADVQGSSLVSTSSNSPNPPSIDPTGTGDNLILAFCAYDLGTITITAWPTNYADNHTNHRGANSAGVGIGIATRNVTGGAVEDPGAFTMSAIDGNHAGVIVIPPAAQGGGDVTGTGGSAFGWATAASGTETITGAAASGFGFATAASGTETFSGSGGSAFGWATDASGTVTDADSGVTGTGASSFGWGTAASGTETITGTSASAFGFALAASGSESISGQAASAFSFATAGTGSATSVDSVPGTATASVSYWMVATATVERTHTATATVS